MKKQRESIIISGVAIGQWRNSTKKGLGLKKNEAEDKIKRAIILGKPVFMYKTGDYIIKYHDLNILVSRDGIVLTIWRHHDKSSYVYTSESSKAKYKSMPSRDVENFLLSKHELVIGGHFKMQHQGVGFR